jgi:hypothetical protein
MIIKASWQRAVILAAGLLVLFASPVMAADTGATHPKTANAGNESMLATSDQLSDSDRSLQEGRAAGTTAASPVPPATAATSESSISDHTSLVGKIFIGLGALLTMASAARMFIT